MKLLFCAVVLSVFNSETVSLICDPECINGVCDGNGICICFENYTLLYENYCEPLCDPSCEFGRCATPNDCRCQNGYRKNDTNWYQCEPVCDQECVNSECDSPNNCKCLDGYVLSSWSDFECFPICEEGCLEDMKCVAPPNHCAPRTTLSSKEKDMVSSNNFTLSTTERSFTSQDQSSFSSDFQILFSAVEIASGILCLLVLLTVTYLTCLCCCRDLIFREKIYNIDKIESHQEDYDL
ncbi:hypothetical protein ACFFRR_009150 [Megaselia abdita]